jgi:hypothetical protein
MLITHKRCGAHDIAAMSSGDDHSMFGSIMLLLHNLFTSRLLHLHSLSCELKHAGHIAWIAARKQWLGEVCIQLEENGSGASEDDHSDPNDISFPFRPRHVSEQWRLGVKQAVCCEL